MFLRDAKWAAVDIGETNHSLRLELSFDARMVGELANVSSMFEGDLVVVVT